MTYEEWNQALLEHFFRDDKADECVALAADRLALQEAASTSGKTFLTAEKAEDDFLLAVLEKLSRRAGWNVAGIMPGRTPACLGLLAVQVLAVYHMQNDGEYKSSAYWPRLRGLLGQETYRTGQLPDGLTRDLQGKLWSNVERWLSNKRYCRGERGLLLLPPLDVGRYYVKLPMSQALLRKEDLQHLPDWYERCDFQAFERIPLSVLRKKLLNSMKTEKYLWKPHAARVIEDELRQDLALVQISLHLSSWNGEPAPERARSSHSPTLRLWASLNLKKRRRQALNVGLLRKGGKGFWSRLELESTDQLFSGLQIQLENYQATYRPYTPFLRLFSKSPLDGSYIETRFLKPGEQALMMYRPDMYSERFIQELSDITESSQGPLYRLPGLPNGWGVIRMKLVSDLSVAAVSWRPYLQLEGHTIRAVGGLKLKRAVWMEGAGPRILVENPGPDTCLRVASEGFGTQTIPLSENPILVESLTQPGCHQIWVAGDKSSSITVNVRNLSPKHTKPGWWNFSAKRWPEHGGEPADLTLQGLFFDGDLSTSAPASASFAEHALLKQLLALRSGGRVRLTSAERTSLRNSCHPIGRALSRCSPEMRPR